MKHLRIAFTVMLLLLLGLEPHVQACRIVPVPPPDPRPPRPVPMRGITTKSHQFTVDIDDQVARVTVEAVFHNPNRFQIEGEYIFPIEKNAAVRGFSMWVNGKELKADLLPAKQAEKIYTDIVRRRKDPALLEYMGTNLIRCRIFPIMPNADVRVKLAYTQVLKTDAGLTRFRYPLRSAKPDAGKVGTLSGKITVKTDNELRTVYCPTHQTDIKRPEPTKAVLGLEKSDFVPERDVQVFFMESQATVGAGLIVQSEPGEDGYFMLTVAPTRNLQAERQVSKDIIFAIDTSGSMSGDKIKQARNALKFCLNNLNKGDRFNVITFSTTTDLMFRNMIEATEENIQVALERVDKIQAGGGTAINEALTESLKMLGGKQELTMLVFLTDGIPTIGETDVGRIVRNVKQTNDSQTRIFAFGVGYDVNTDLIDNVAKQSNGTQEYVTPKENIEVKVSSFYSKIANPILSDVKLTVKGVDIYDHYPSKMPDLFKGSELMVLGRFRKPGDATVVISGKLNQTTREYTYPLQFEKTTRNDFLPGLWAFRKVAYMMESIRLNGPNEELKNEIVKLGKQYGIMTPYTSFLVLEEEEARRHADVLRRSREAFERAKGGRAGVGASKQVQEAKRAAPTAEADAAAPGYWAGDAKDEEGRKELTEALQNRARERMRKIRDKTFVLDTRQGLWYDTAYDEDQHGKPEEITWFSDAFFKLTRRHTELAKYLVEQMPMVIVIDGKAYRFVAQEKEQE